MGQSPCSNSLSLSKLQKKRDEIFRYHSLNKHQLNFTDLVREVKKKFIVHFMLRLVEYLSNC